MARARRVSTEKRQTGDDATGTPRTRQIDDFPSITSIEGLSIIVITLSGRGNDDPPPDDAARTRLRDLARDWLRDDLAGWSKATVDKSAPSREELAETLAYWKVDRDLEGIRSGAELAKLPERERSTWRALWAEVDALLRRAAASTPALKAELCQK
jgi:hypothetical protein